MANPVCSAASLLVNCFQGTVIDNFRRKCLMVYLMAAELNAIGGTNYLNALISPASGGFLRAATDLGPSSNEDTRDLYGQRTIGLYELGVQLNNAVAAGVATATINVRMQNIKCLINVPEPTLDKMLVVLACALGVHKSYPQ